MNLNRDELVILAVFVTVLGITMFFTVKESLG